MAFICRWISILTDGMCIGCLNETKKVEFDIEYCALQFMAHFRVTGKIWRGSSSSSYTTSGYPRVQFLIHTQQTDEKTDRERERDDEENES